MKRKPDYGVILALTVFGAVLLASALSAVPRQENTVQTAAWGLSFRTEGEPPVADTNAQTLAEYDAAYLGDTSEPVLYLTFDAGYENGYTGQILDTLKAHKVPAAFFLVGNYIEQNPELVNRMAAEGHIVGNHTYHHKAMAELTEASAFAEELTTLEVLYKKTTGQELPRYYRPPRGEYSVDNLKQAQNLGYKTVFWSLAYVDWLTDDQPTAEEAFSKLLPRTHKGAVILLHSTSKTNADILNELLARWEEQGYRFGSLEELFAG